MNTKNIANQLQGRQMKAGPTDGAAEVRVPNHRLRLIPPEARASFIAFDPLKVAIKPGENDLTRIFPGNKRAAGEIIEVTGKVTDERGRPVRRSLIEIWNANKWGRYSHIEDHTDYPLDPNFLGIGKTLTNDEGEYIFWTVYPGSYLARPDIGRWRPSHIHFSIRGGSARLITQMYFKGDKNLATDPMYIVLGDDAPRSIAKEYQTHQNLAQHNQAQRGFQFDIVIGGPNANYFETN
ncbi:protocatechuate 3,4-dioxygenase subunit beta [Aliikangiella maris]|uniref:Protocatechuate 3,4-dioxygenase subunit beta n=2 Tax=Aliikangiella maris TaxID=3162458 RepID=A0ABV3MNH6_9GAMM